MTNKEFIDEYERIINKFKEDGSFEKIKKHREKHEATYNSCKRELEDITNDEFLENSMEKKKRELLEKIKK
ncbi:hypothetical protein [uncultured Ilyobacter sp.]|uniref:hypothetical protein n=1 Tax=uncultured Ilyobacter sp. TaxID=544433 RepID=UPI0029C74270|nr:hypothetical protein [uncultured Ilyobacter sp.]